MNRLSALDALFLYMESPKTPMHVGSVTIFRPTAERADNFQRFREHTAARLDLLPSYRRRLKPTPLNIDHPVWVIETDLDLDYHICHAALPRPGTMAQLRELVSRLHEVPLDRSRPLWQYHLIEGLENGAFAVYVKVHHAAMDGIAGIAMLNVVYDDDPEPAPPLALRRLVRPSEPPADFLELTSTAIADFLRQGVRAVSSLPGLLGTLTRIAPNLVRDLRYLLGFARGMPSTRFNGTISNHRSYGTCSVSLSEAKTIAKAHGATINDVVLAVCAGALRRYLSDHHDLPDAPLVAGVPASLRAPGDTSLNNQVVFSVSRLPTDVAGPLPRLVAAQAAAREGKHLFADIKGMLTTNISILGAPLIMSALPSLMLNTRAVLPPFFNTVISNVPGPRQPVYCAGAPAEHYFPISIPYHGAALNITVQSYLDQLDFGLIACRRTVPDVQRIADYVVEDFEALRQADEALRRPDAIETIVLAPKPRRAKMPAKEPKAARKARKKDVARAATSAPAPAARKATATKRAAASTARSRAGSKKSSPEAVSAPARGNGANGAGGEPHASTVDAAPEVAPNRAKAAPAARRGRRKQASAVTAEG